MPTAYNQAIKVLEAQVGKSTWTAQAVWVGLSSTAPTNGNPPTNITEPSGGAYARKPTSASDWGNATVVGSTPTITNAAPITFTPASADWLAGANLTYGVLYDALTGGNVIGYGLLQVAKNVLSGDTASIGAGGLTITLV